MERNMSGSETGVMTSREALSAGLENNPTISPQNMRLPFGPDATSLYKSLTTTTTITTTNNNNNNNHHHHHNASPTYQQPGGGVGEGSATASVTAPSSSLGINVNSVAAAETAAKRKRGRPRKYGPDGTMALALVSAPQHQQQPFTITQSSGGGGFASPPSGSSFLNPQPTPTSTVKKARGRPPGSSKKQQLQAMGLPGVGFTPHVITVKAGEDVSAKIMSFSQHGPRAVCILSANGAISNVTLRQPATSGGTVTYEGRFEILSLSGSFMLSENADQRTRTGGLSVSLSGPDGRVLGGCVAGLLTAASPVQVVVGSFIADGRKESKSANQVEPLPAITGVPAVGGLTGASSPPSRGTLSESSGGPGSPLNQSTGTGTGIGTGACLNSFPHGMSGMPWK
ncbi:hypothetical protein K2173_007373 [Erythroxylum novogranatense]|uniref:AT-hook motif nuclear-localized protein n=1 Tax=Erythroxylum novogranatense TaxID=1862640 RepID=A0AAV8T618_9ROSI|nr:hypothetical protein K2173_007373 [Erythroxylum novogranatense]